MNNRQRNYFCEGIDQKGVHIVEVMHCEGIDQKGVDIVGVMHCEARNQDKKDEHMD